MRVTFIDPDGKTLDLTGEPGESAMRCATNHLVPGIVGECGGAMACATCHGYVDVAWTDKLPPPGAQERDMLAGCIDVRPNSRLTCQIVLSEALDGLVIEVPESQT